jgi:hypothetical protein
VFELSVVKFVLDDSSTGAEVESVLLEEVDEISLVVG